MRVGQCEAGVEVRQLWYRKNVLIHILRYNSASFSQCRFHHSQRQRQGKLHINHVHLVEGGCHPHAQLFHAAASPELGSLGCSAACFSKLLLQCELSNCPNFQVSGLLYPHSCSWLPGHRFGLCHHPLMLCLGRVFCLPSLGVPVAVKSIVHRAAI